ncbi:Hsp20/alpha crystallin family protein [Ectobacillus panaciterrae]|uniref:Hsp20/alpha crystallin family protein n=1 Tax=Ectobacillus panaciterrae TaxID=363872 RepID=UPI000415CF1F|nr:Hsp20/alpha crystallin family protein [Ectobacillus panaciterrae]
MALIPYEPFRHLDNVRREFDRFFMDFPTTNRGLEDHFLGLRIDVHETENEVVAICDIPGLEKKEDVNIDIENNKLTISGTINRTNEIREGRIHRQERFVGHFNRSVSLPGTVSNEGVKASYKNGVLEVHIPKLKNDNKRRIDVEFH